MKDASASDLSNGSGVTTIAIEYDPARLTNIFPVAEVPYGVAIATWVIGAGLLAISVFIAITAWRRRSSAPIKRSQRVPELVGTKVRVVSGGPAAFFILMALSLCGIPLLVWHHGSNTWPAAAAIFTAIIGLVTIRAVRLGLVASDNGITVRNTWKTHRLTWPEVKRFADGKKYWGEGGPSWALRVVLRDGRHIDVFAVEWNNKKHPDPPERIWALMAIARRHNVPATLTGQVAAIIQPIGDSAR